MNKNEKEIKDIQNLITQMKNDPAQMERLKKEVKDKGLEGKVKEFEKQYGNKINDFIASLNAKGEMTDEEKAKMVMDMKKKLPKDAQKQLATVIESMKSYLKNK